VRVTCTNAMSHFIKPQYDIKFKQNDISIATHEIVNMKW